MAPTLADLAAEAGTVYGQAARERVVIAAEQHHRGERHARERHLPCLAGSSNLRRVRHCGIASRAALMANRSASSGSVLVNASRPSALAVGFSRRRSGGVVPGLDGPTVNAITHVALDGAPAREP
jgi:hypothetical protein